MQREAREEEEESSEEEDNEDDDTEGVHPYDWLDSMARRGNSPRSYLSRPRDGRRRLSYCSVSQRTPTLGELQWH
jgi:hypothetical protein